MRLRGHPAPCLAYDRGHGWAVLKDLRGKTQILLVPTTRIAGIEDARLAAPGGPNYWQAAWRARVWFERRAGRAAPRTDVALAINSAEGRTQDQLHIHIDCVRAEVKTALAGWRDRITWRWRELPGDLEGHRYWARRVRGEDLAERDPFVLLARGVPGAAADMAEETEAVIGARFADGGPGFYLLATRGGTDANPHGAAEELMDHDCAVLEPDAAAR